MEFWHIPPGTYDYNGVQIILRYTGMASLWSSLELTLYKEGIHVYLDTNFLYL
jgi:hypothetical protein